MLACTRIVAGCVALTLPEVGEPSNQLVGVSVKGLTRYDSVFGDGLVIVTF